MEKALLLGQPHNARGATLGCARRSGWWCSTPCAAIRGCASITKAFGPRANMAGRRHRGDAKAARSSMARGYSPPPLRSAPFSDPRHRHSAVTNKYLTHSTVSSAANATNESGGKAEPRAGSGGDYGMDAGGAACGARAGGSQRNCRNLPVRCPLAAGSWHFWPFLMNRRGRSFGERRRKLVGCGSVSGRSKKGAEPLALYWCCSW